MVKFDKIINLSSSTSQNKVDINGEFYSDSLKDIIFTVGIDNQGLITCKISDNNEADTNIFIIDKIEKLFKSFIEEYEGQLENTKGHSIYFNRLESNEKEKSERSMLSDGKTNDSFSDVFKGLGISGDYESESVGEDDEKKKTLAEIQKQKLNFYNELYVSMKDVIEKYTYSEDDIISTGEEMVYDTLKVRTTKEELEEPERYINDMKTFLSSELDFTSKYLEELEEDSDNTLLYKGKVKILTDVLNSISKTYEGEELPDFFSDKKVDFSYTEKTKVDFSNLSSKDINTLYDTALKNCDSELVKEYISTILNPIESNLDKENLALNLYTIIRLISFNIDFEFDDTIKFKSDKYYTKKYDGMYTNEKELNIAFNIYDTSLFNSVLLNVFKNGEKKYISNDQVNVYNVLNDTNLDIDEYFEKTIDVLSNEGSSIISCEKLKDVFGGEIKKIPSFDNNYKNRDHTYINKDYANQISKIEEYSFILNKGNKFLLNPKKPIIYFNKINSPFYDFPVLVIDFIGNMKINKSQSYFVKLSR